MVTIAELQLDTVRRSVDHGDPNPSGYICYMAPTSISHATLWKRRKNIQVRGNEVHVGDLEREQVVSSTPCTLSQGGFSVWGNAHTYTPFLHHLSKGNGCACFKRMGVKKESEK